MDMNFNVASSLNKTLIFSATGVREYQVRNSSICNTSDECKQIAGYCVEGNSNGNHLEGKRVKKRLNFEDDDENYSAKKIKRSKKSSVKCMPRCDSSLSLLTKKFVNLLLKAGSTVNLNFICDELSVPKRRLYDITNVLEGAGLLDKPSRNLVQWKGIEQELWMQELQDDLNDLEEKENMLDETIKNAEMTLISLREQSDDYAYVSYEDLKSINILKEKTVIGIEGDSTTKLAIPELFRLHSKSQNCISAYLLDDHGLSMLENNLHPSDILKISNNKICLRNDSLLKKALISGDDEFSLDRNILLQTEDQIIESSSLDVEMDYTFVLDHEEGFVDLFDPFEL